MPDHIRNQNRNYVPVESPDYARNFRANEPWPPNQGQYAKCTGTINGSYPIYLIQEPRRTCSACFDPNQICQTQCMAGCPADSPACQPDVGIIGNGVCEGIDQPQPGTPEAELADHFTEADCCGDGICQPVEQGHPWLCPNDTAIRDCTINDDKNNLDPGTFNPPDAVETVELCDQVSDPALKAACRCCGGDAGSCSSAAGVLPQGGAGIWTSFGCVNTRPASIVKTVVIIGLYLSGGIILLVIVVAAFLLSTSRGDPKQVNQAKDLITSAITGVIIIIFSVAILRFIGTDILQLPGFGGS